MACSKRWKPSRLRRGASRAGSSGTGWEADGCRSGDHERVARSHIRHDSKKDERGWQTRYDRCTCGGSPRASNRVVLYRQPLKERVGKGGYWIHASCNDPRKGLRGQRDAGDSHKEGRNDDPLALRVGARGARRWLAWRASTFRHCGQDDQLAYGVRGRNRYRRHPRRPPAIGAACCSRYPV